MKINLLVCLKCGDGIYSRANHDCRHCSCGAIYVDGGCFSKYGRIGAIDANATKSVKWSLPKEATEQVLYNDWAKGTDKYGVVKNALKEKSCR